MGEAAGGEGEVVAAQFGKVGGVKKGELGERTEQIDSFVRSLSDRSLGGSSCPNKPIQREGELKRGRRGRRRMHRRQQ